MAHNTRIYTAEEIARFNFEREQKQAHDAVTGAPNLGFTKRPTVLGNVAQPVKELAAPTKVSSAKKKWEIERLLEKYDLHPIEELIKMIKYGHGGEQLTADQRIKTLDMLAGYTVPKVKSIEVSGQVDHSITVKIVRFADVQKQVEDAKAIAIDAEVKSA
jgi:hypothetical protein